MVGRLGLNPIVATLGTNALLFGAVLGISGGIPRSTTRLLNPIAGGRTFGIPNAVLLRARVLALVARGEEDRCGQAIRGDRRQPGRGAGDGPAVQHAPRRGVRLGAAAVRLAGILLAGIANQPTAFQGNAYLLTSVAVVVLGGTSLLGGRGYPAATVVAALFLSQLDQFVLALGVPFAVRTLVQAAALAVGVAIYTVTGRPSGGGSSLDRARGTRDHLRIPLHPERAAPREPPRDAAIARKTEENMIHRRISAPSPRWASRHWLLAGCSATPAAATTRASGGTSVEGAPDWCGPDEASRPARRLRRQQLAAGHHRAGRTRSTSARA